MKIRTQKNAVPAKVKSQIEERSAIRARVLDFLNHLPPRTPGQDTFLECLRLTELSYQLLAEEVPLAKLDRTKSLIGRHLYVSERHPQPVSKGGEPIYGRYPEIVGTTPSGVLLFPVLQLDLSWVSVMCDRDFEPSLLQLWLEPPYFVEGVLRLIPLAEVHTAEALPIKLDEQVYDVGISHLEDESSKLVCRNERGRSGGPPDVSEQTSLQILDCKPIGMTGPDVGDHVIEELTESLGEDFPEAILDDLWQYSGFSNSSGISPNSKLCKALTLFGYYPTSSGGERFFGGDGCLFGIAMGARVSSVVTYAKDVKAGKVTFAHMH